MSLVNFTKDFGEKEERNGRSIQEMFYTISLLFVDSPEKLEHFCEF